MNSSAAGFTVQDRVSAGCFLWEGTGRTTHIFSISCKRTSATSTISRNNAFLVTWHAFLKEIQAAQQGLDEGQNRILTMYILKSFFALPYDGRDFYVQFEERMKKARQDLAMD